MWWINLCRLCCSEKEEAAASPAVAPILCIMGLMSLAATRFYTLVDIDLPLEKSSARHGRTLLSTDLESTVPFFSVSVAILVPRQYYNPPPHPSTPTWQLPFPSPFPSYLPHCCCFLFQDQGHREGLKWYVMFVGLLNFWGLVVCILVHYCNDGITIQGAKKVGMVWLGNRTHNIAYFAMLGDRSCFLHVLCAGHITWHILLCRMIDLVFCTFCEHQTHVFTRWNCCQSKLISMKWYSGTPHSRPP